MKVDVECTACGRIFQKEKKQVNEATKLGYSMYCSPKCQKNSKKKDIEVQCANCGHTFTTKPWIVAKSLSGNVYCSTSCAASKNNALFKWGGIAYSEALDRAGNSCEVCGYSNDTFLKFFHKDGNRMNTDIDNIVVLCPTHYEESVHASEFSSIHDTIDLT